MPTKRSRPPRVLLVGQGVTAESALRSLLEHFQVVGLVRTAGHADPVIRIARNHGLTVESDATLAAVCRSIHRLDPDAVVISSYDRVFPADLVAERPFINVHYAPLPRYRGRATVNWAIINGESHAAISIHSVVPGLDAGGLLFQKEIEIGPRDTVTDLYRRLNDIQWLSLGEAVARRLTGDEGMRQDETVASYACTRLPADGEIDWKARTIDTDRLIRALTEPFPGAFTWLGLERLLVRSAIPVDDAPQYVGRIPGRVTKVDRRTGTVDVLTGDGVLRLIEVARPGTSGVNAATVIDSVRQSLGLNVADLVDQLVASNALPHLGRSG